MAVLSQAQALIQKRTLKERQGVSVWVTAREAFWVAMEALRSHKLRSFLTLLGVVIATRSESGIAGARREKRAAAAFTNGSITLPTG